MKKDMTRSQQQAMFARLNAGRTQGAINRDLSVRAAETLSNTPENVKSWKQNPRRIDIEGIDTPKRRDLHKMIKGKSINNSKDNSSLPKKAGDKTTMSEIGEIKNKINKLENEWETARNKRSEYMGEYRANGGTDVYQDKKYLELDGKMSDIRETIQNLQFKYRMMKLDEKKERVIDKNLDFTAQFGNDSFEISNRKDYESIAKKLGVQVESDNTIRKDYGLKFAEYNAAEWTEKTRVQRVRQVLGSQYQRILEKQDAEKRKNDPETKKANDRFIENQTKADKFHQELDNDIYPTG